MSAAESLEPRELARLWSAVLGRLELEVNPHNFNTWLRGTRVIRWEGAVLIVEARTSFSCDWLNHRLITVVQRAAAHVFGSELNVLFVPDGVDTGPSTPAAVDATTTPVDPTGPILGNLNRSFRFESYLTADGNRLAYESCLAIVEPLDFSVSPVVIYGAPGMGKTHLLHALAHRASAAGWSVACLSAEEFTTRYMTALRHKDVGQFQSTFRRVKLLVIDDLQYIAGKRATQEELVHTFDAVVNGGGHVVCASELHPFEIDLPDRLASRLAAGIVTRVEPFLSGERKAFIERAARERRTSLPSWAADRIAGCEVPSVRVLQGAVNAAIALQQRELLDMRRLDAELTRISLAAICPAVLEDRMLLDIIVRHFETTFEELVGRSRKLPVGRARAVAIATLKERGRSLSEIARTLGDRHPSTISELVERGQQILEADAVLRSQLAI